MTNFKSKKGRELLACEIEKYFSMCDAENEAEKKIVKPYTLSGLMCHLGICAEELDALSESRAARRIILAAKLKIEAFIEENALSGKLSGTAAINSLKCRFGWKEKNAKDDGAKSFSVTLEGDADELGT